MQKYKTLNHCKFKLKFYLIFSTKYRRSLLNEIRNDLFNSFKRAEKMQNNWIIDFMEIDKNHIHFLIDANNMIYIPDMIHKLKQVSTYDMWKKHYNYMRKFYWKQHHLWTKGYFICSIGDASEEIIENYIKNQG